MYSLNPVFPHDFGHPVSAAHFANFAKIAMNPAITVNSTTQRIGVADEFQQSLVILFSGRYRVMEPDIKSGTGNLKDPTHCNDRPDFTVIVDKAILQSGSLAKYRAAFFRISRSSSVRLSCAFSLRISVLASSKSWACCPLLSGLTARSHLYRLCADTPSRSDTSAIE